MEIKDLIAEAKTKADVGVGLCTGVLGYILDAGYDIIPFGDATNPATVAVLASAGAIGIKRLFFDPIAGRWIALRTARRTLSEAGVYIRTLEQSDNTASREAARQFRIRWSALGEFIAFNGVSSDELQAVEDLRHDVLRAILERPPGQIESS